MKRFVPTLTKVLLACLLFCSTGWLRAPVLLSSTPTAPVWTFTYAMEGQVATLTAILPWDVWRDYYDVNIDFMLGHSCLHVFGANVVDLCEMSQWDPPPHCGGLVTGTMCNWLYGDFSNITVTKDNPAWSQTGEYYQISYTATKKQITVTLVLTEQFFSFPREVFRFLQATAWGIPMRPGVPNAYSATKLMF